MSLKWIKSEIEANKYIEKTYILEHNEKYCIKAVSTNNLHVPLSDKERERFSWYFAKESTRKLRRDGTVYYNNKVYQIKKWEKLYN